MLALTFRLQSGGRRSDLASGGPTAFSEVNVNVRPNRLPCGPAAKHLRGEELPDGNEWDCEILQW
jgi:hypothetical protein